MFRFTEYFNIFSVRFIGKKVAIENKLNNIESQKGLDSSSESSYEDDGDNFLQTLKFKENDKENFLQNLKAVTSPKFYTKITLLIDYNYKKEFTSLIDSVADLTCIQEGLIHSRYFHKTSHSHIYNFV